MKVFITGTGSIPYAKMFEERGWNVVESLKDADLVQFTGGADVAPSLYKQQRHPATWMDSKRDAEDMFAYQAARKLGIAMAGICRGGQFLNVMNGGQLFQDVTHHAVAKGHIATDVYTGKEIQVSSTHHQMMIPAAGGLILLLANEADKKIAWPIGKANPFIRHGKEGNDVEAVLYKKTNCLCFQPHPEILRKESDCQVLYFKWINSLLGLK